MLVEVGWKPSLYVGIDQTTEPVLAIWVSVGSGFQGDGRVGNEFCDADTYIMGWQRPLGREQSGLKRRMESVDIRQKQVWGGNPMFYIERPLSSSSYIR